MIHHIVIPFLLDLYTVSDPSEVRQFAIEKKLDRKFIPKGPLINRYLVRRVISILSVDGTRLPTMAPRDDPERTRSQAKLRDQLEPPIDTQIDSETLNSLASAIRGERAESEIALLTQQAIGQLFDRTYRADETSWDAAQTLDNATRQTNPIISIIGLLSGRITRARQTLLRKVGQSPAGVHATGIAVHNLVRGFKQMRKLYACEGLSPETVVSKCIFVPRSVLRQASSTGKLGKHDFQPGTLFLLHLARAYADAPSASIAFNANTWAQCPAANFVPQLLGTVWQRAKENKTIEGIPNII
jgi:hypothetical protein